MIDLNNPDTYAVQDYGGGNLLYRDASTGQMYDPSDLSSPLSTSDVQQYGAPANTPGAISAVGTDYTQSSFHAPSPNSTANSGGGGGMNMSGLTGLFTAVGGALGSLINPPKVAGGAGGQPLVYDAVRGSYVPANAVGASVSNISSIPMWIVIGGVAVVAILVLRKG